VEGKNCSKSEVGNLIESMGEGWYLKGSERENGERLEKDRGYSTKGVRGVSP